MAAGGWDTRFNFDGLLTFSSRLNNYVQLFRSGAMEAVDTTLLEPYEPYPNFVSTSEFEKRVTSAVLRYIEFLKKLGLVPPVFVMVTLLGVKGFKATTGPRTFSAHSIDRDTLILPDVMIESYESSVGPILKPIFDTVAQSAGLSESNDS
jgi:hypothetical protein